MHDDVIGYFGNLDVWSCEVSADVFTSFTQIEYNVTYFHNFDLNCFYYNGKTSNSLQVVFRRAPLFNAFHEFLIGLSYERPYLVLALTLIMIS